MVVVHRRGQASRWARAASAALAAALAVTLLGWSSPSAAADFVPVRMVVGSDVRDSLGVWWRTASGTVGGKVSSVSSPIAGTTDDALYQRERAGLSAWNVPVGAAGTYTVLLRQAELTLTAPGKRVYDVQAEGAVVVRRLDLFAATGGRYRAHDVSFDVLVTDGTLNLTFVKHVGQPKVSAMRVTLKSALAATAEPTPTATAEPTPSPSPTAQPSPSPSPTPTPTPEPSPSPSPSPTATAEPAPSPTPEPSPSPSPSPTATAEPAPSPTPEPSPSPSPSPTATAEPAPSPTPEPSPSPSPTPEPTPSPTPSPTPTAEPTPTPEPSPAPVKPGPDTTGVPAGTPLRPHYGDLVITVAGTHLDAVDVHGYVTIKAPDVRITRSVIRGSAEPLTAHRGLITSYDAANVGLVVEDSELRPEHPSYWQEGIKAQNATLRRVEITGTVDGVGVHGDNLHVIDSWIHGLRYYDYVPYTSDRKSHNDGIQVHLGKGLRVVNSTITGGSSAAIMVTPSTGVVSDAQLVGNWLNHGGCTVNVSEKRNGPIEGLVVKDNRFGRDTSVLDCPILLPGTTAPIAVITGNVYDDTGLPVRVRTN